MVGQNQNTEAEINPDFVQAHGIQVVRRSTGGGAVYHDLGNLNYSFITDVSDSQRITMERFTRPIVEALRQLGIDAGASGRNDILADGKKVSGTAQRLYQNRILHHGTLLFDSDPSMVAGALRVDPAKFQSKATQSVRSRIGNIRPLLRQDMDLPAFWDYLKRTLAGSGLHPLTLPEAELEQVRRLQREKYDTWDWNYGRSPAYNLHTRVRFPGGTLEPQLHVTGGVIDRAVFYGDFLSLRPLDALCAALQGCPFRREAVAERLGRFPLQEYFGAITAGEVLDAVFSQNPTT